MLNSKERSRLLALANSLNTTVYVGKNGITESVLQQIDEMLLDHELLKIGIQKNADLTAKEAMFTICQELSAEPVHAIGYKVIIYRYSTKEGVEHIDYSENPKSEKADSKPKAQPKSEARQRTSAKPVGKKYGKSFDKSEVKSKARGQAPVKKNGITVYKTVKGFGKKKK